MKKETKNEKTVWIGIQAISQWTTLHGEIIIPSELVRKHIRLFQIDDSFIRLKQLDGERYSLRLDEYSNGKSLGMLYGSDFEVFKALGEIMGALDVHQDKYMEKINRLIKAIIELKSVGYQVQEPKEWHMEFKDEDGYARRIQSELDEILIEVSDDLAKLYKLNIKKEKKEDKDKIEKAYAKVDELLKD